MALKGKNKHYLWNTIQIRHWLATASQCQFSKILMQNIIDDIFDNMENVIIQVTNLLPNHFPKQISESLFAGMRQIKNQCTKYQKPKKKRAHRLARVEERSSSRHSKAC